jgi:hypothetical protein
MPGEILFGTVETRGVCRYCNGERGWVGEAKFKATPEEMK